MRFFFNPKFTLLFISCLFLRFNLFSFNKVEENLLLVDSVGTLRFEDILRDSINFRFKPLAGRDAYIKNTKHVYWLKFSLSDNDEPLFLNFHFLFSDIQLYIPGDSGYSVLKAGLNYPRSTRSFNSNFPLFKIPPTAAKGYYYVRLSSTSNIGLGFLIETFESTYNTSNSVSYTYGFIFGIFFIVAFYNLTLSFITRQLVYLYYCFYVISFIIYAVVSWGYVQDVLNLETITWYKDYWTVPYAFMTISLLLYAKSFLNLKELVSGFNKVLNLLIALRLLILLCGKLFSIDAFYSSYVDLPFQVVAFIFGIVRLKNGFRPAKFFVIGFAFLFLGFSIHTVKIVYLSDKFLLHMTLFIAGVIEIAFFSLAVADRFKTLEAEKLKAQQITIEQLKVNELLKDKVNRELEDKVKERTAEIERMNALLNAHNEQLTHDVKDITEARVMQKLVTFEEFKEIYPDEESCLKFLAEFKWSKGFKCLKCKNPTFYNTSDPYIRRCANCSYVESVTTGTIFNRSKFSLLKGFYILFLVNSGSNISLDELSSTVGLRKQTCLAFKNKVLKAISLSKDKARKNKDGWSHLITASTTTA